MSSRGSPIPKDLADPPAPPFQPVLPASRSSRPVVRRTVPSSALHPPARPFGEIGKEDDDSWEVPSVLSGSTRAGEPDNEGGEAAPFVPRWRDVKQKRPVVRKVTGPVPMQKEETAVQEEAKEEEKAGSTEEKRLAGAKEEDKRPARKDVDQADPNIDIPPSPSSLLPPSAPV
ncbi:hypothetical protein JCM10213_002915 [Rhodosporidiobolus nylandii]